MRFVVGTMLLAGAVGVSSVAARSFAIPPAIALNCSVESASLVLQPPGRLRVIEYRYNPDNHLLPRSTGKVVVAADAGSRVVNPAAPCHRIKAVTKRESGFAGPWPRTVESRINCVAPSKDRGLDFQLRPIVNKKKRVVGYRIVVLQQTVPDPKPGVEPNLVTVAVADGWVTRSGGGIRYDPTMCGRNTVP